MILITITPLWSRHQHIKLVKFLDGYSGKFPTLTRVQVFRGRMGIKSWAMLGMAR